MPSQSFPHLPLKAAAALIGFSILAAIVGRIDGQGAQEPVSTPVAERLLRFEDRADGAVLVYDAQKNPTDLGATPIDVAVGENGFLRGTLRGFARTRHLSGVQADAPFRLTAWADGRLTLVDPATGRHTELEAFGIDNVKVFANFLPLPARTAANLSQSTSLIQ
jgi:putative photosynthetic complex assembly protein